MKRACVLLAEGFEEVEAITAIDYLRRAGIEVKTIGTMSKKVQGGHGICVLADEGPSTLKEYFDCLVIPGGARGVENLAKDKNVINFILRHNSQGAIIAAICAAPVLVLYRACNILGGKKFTVFPGLEANTEKAKFLAEAVVVDGNIITSRAAGTAGVFSKKIIEVLVGTKASEDLSQKILL